MDTVTAPRQAREPHKESLDYLTVCCRWTALLYNIAPLRHTDVAAAAMFRGEGENNSRELLVTRQHAGRVNVYLRARGWVA
ncbi:Hypothetical protein SMAX5B_010312 [Scophthalmus maximus]|uniref:Uncharacterized protein n=1 Tax=Scophthalmus maximus TaxID=52904 RepID=A0A2U9BTS1_SCOMX|nr:Hypothetical protein SMAX5B_010312 [Scophthalmus maximus]